MQPQKDLNKENIRSDPNKIQAPGQSTGRSEAGKPQQDSPGIDRNYASGSREPQSGQKTPKNY